MIWQIIATFFCSLFGTCEEGACTTVSHSKAEYFVCTYRADEVQVRLFLHDQKGKPYGQLRNVESNLKKPATMLMNGGMYHANLDAVGLYIEAGNESKNISTKGGWGNFHLLPNGIFWGKDGRYGVSETKAYLSKKLKPDFATQSGPMLVINGKLHPKFLKKSDSLKIRNGVGISKDRKKIHFAISKTAVSFWNFGQLFRAKLKSHNALFLDGTVSALKTKNYHQGGWRALGPIIGVFEKP